MLRDFVIFALGCNVGVVIACFLLAENWRVGFTNMRRIVEKLEGH